MSRLDSLSSTQLSDLTQAFLICDREETGIVDARDIHNALVSAGVLIDASCVDEVLQQLGVKDLDFVEVTLVSIG